MSPAADPDWLHTLLQAPPDATLLIGGVGHLLLNREEEAAVTAALESRVLPLLRDRAQGRPLTLITGVAPGADVLLMDRTTSWCERHAIRLNKIALVAVPVPLLIGDWVERAQREGYTLSKADHHWLQSTVQVALQGCDAVHELFQRDQAEALADPQRRQLQYQRLAAMLVEYSDVLVAVLHPGYRAQPGGTAEIVAWRQDRSKLPAALRTRSRPVPPSADHGLILINPMPAEVTLSSSGSDPRALRVLANAEAAMAAGNDLLANDLLYQALQQGLQHPELPYLRVQVLARVGSTRLALSEYEERAPPPAERDSRWLTLLGRIKKDLALRSGSRRLLLEAAEPYLEAWQRGGSSYSAINAASLHALAGELPRAQDYARLALEALSHEPETDAPAQYFAAATRAEVCLLLGDDAAVQRHLKRADALPVERSHRSRTVQQLRRLCAALGLDSRLLDALTLPPLIALRRLGLAEIVALPLRADIELPPLPANASVFAGLCDSFDLLLAETLLQQGHALHLVLPYRAERLLEGTRERLGDAAATRLQDCLAAATRVHAERGFLETELAWAASNVTERVLGMALLAGEQFGGSLQQISIDPRQEPARFTALPPLAEGPARAGQALRQQMAQEPPQAAPAGRRMVGLIFADFVGFQRLEDQELPVFWNQLMRGIAQILSRHGESVLLRQTWGDALHVVTDDATTAAAVMVDIQHYLDLQRLKPDAVLGNLTLRIAGHYAPAFESHDPIHAARTYFGTQLSLTARIEPVTPPGQVYATEAFAARLALEAPERFALEYAGELELAKRFGAYRLYGLRQKYG